MKGTDKILDAKIDAVKAEVIAASNAAFWLHTSPALEATNVLESTILLAGVGFEQYYNPHGAHYFQKNEDLTRGLRGFTPIASWRSSTRVIQSDTSRVSLLPFPP
jgi:hypothetical protein